MYGLVVFSLAVWIVLPLCGTLVPLGQSVVEKDV